MADYTEEANAMLEDTAQSSADESFNDWEPNEAIPATVSMKNKYDAVSNVMKQGASYVGNKMAQHNTQDYQDSVREWTALDKSERAARGFDVDMPPKMGAAEWLNSSRKKMEGMRKAGIEADQLRAVNKAYLDYSKDVPAAVRDGVMTVSDAHVAIENHQKLLQDTMEAEQGSISGAAREAMTKNHQAMMDQLDATAVKHIRESALNDAAANWEQAPDKAARKALNRSISESNTPNVDASQLADAMLVANNGYKETVKGLQSIIDNPDLTLKTKTHVKAQLNSYKERAQRASAARANQKAAQAATIRLPYAQPAITQQLATGGSVEGAWAEYRQSKSYKGMLDAGYDEDIMRNKFDSMWEAHNVKANKDIGMDIDTPSQERAAMILNDDYVVPRVKESAYAETKAQLARHQMMIMGPVDRQHAERRELANAAIRSRAGKDMAPTHQAMLANTYEGVLNGDVPTDKLVDINSLPGLSKFMGSKSPVGKILSTVNKDMTEEKADARIDLARLTAQQPDRPKKRINAINKALLEESDSYSEMDDIHRRIFLLEHSDIDDVDTLSDLADNARKEDMATFNNGVPVEVLGVSPKNGQRVKADEFLDEEKMEAIKRKIPDAIVEFVAVGPTGEMSVHYRSSGEYGDTPKRMSMTEYELDAINVKARRRNDLRRNDAARAKSARDRKATAVRFKRKESVHHETIKIPKRSKPAKQAKPEPRKPATRKPTKKTVSKPSVKKPQKASPRTKAAPKASNTVGGNSTLTTTTATKKGDILQSS